MPGTPPRLEDLPETFPVFPLSGALLLPGGRLPLNIFEPRYLAMVEDALAAGRMFAMAQPDLARPAGPNGPALYSVGCLGRVVSFSETDDGRYLITLRGLLRACLGTEQDMRRGYRRVRGDFARFAADLAPDEPAFDRPALLTALRTYFARRGIEADREVIARMADAELITTLAMVCPFEPPEKQALLEAATPTERATTLLALLQMDSHAQTADVPRGRAS